MGGLGKGIFLANNPTHWGVESKPFALCCRNSFYAKELRKTKMVKTKRLGSRPQRQHVYIYLQPCKTPHSHSPLINSLLSICLSVYLSSIKFVRRLLKPWVGMLRVVRCYRKREQGGVLKKLHVSLGSPGCLLCSLLFFVEEVS